jgi:DNA gyrase inhibitor GyrI
MKKIGLLVALVAVAALCAAASRGQDCNDNLAPGPDTSQAQVPKPPEVRIRTDTAFAYCAIEMRGSYDRHAAAFEKLYTVSAQQGIFGGYPFGVYYNSPDNTPADSLTWELGFRMAKGEKPGPPLVLKKWPYTTMAVLDFSGEFGGTDETDAFNRVYKWAGEHGYRPAGPLMEEFLNAPSQDEKGLWVGRVNIIVPVEKAAPAQGKKAK